jgi:SagB-type dehydrogenase family enzyme
MAFRLSLRDDVTMADRGPDVLQLNVPGRPATVLAFKQLSPALREVFARLGAGGVDEETITEGVMEQDGPQGLFKLTHFLKKLEDARLICRTVPGAAGPIARIVPISDRWVMAEAPAAPVRLSRFAAVRRAGAHLVVESPLGYARVEVMSPDAVAAIGLMASATTAASLAHKIGSSVETATALLTLLASAGALTADDESGVPAEDTHPSLMQWEFHDLFFHSRSRLGRHNHPFGGTLAFEGVVPPLPAFKPPMGERIALPTPDLERLMREDVPFAKVVEERRSVREQGVSPISVAQLGEFLYRAARAIEVFSTEHGEVSKRVYPAGGGLYEMEVYAVVDRADGLDAGLYHYDPNRHGLERVSARTPAVDALIDQAFYTADGRSRPQVLLVLTARFQRMQWKYQSMVYAAVLKHVGVLYQQMYLTATAMGLAPCALGGGHADLFADAAGLDYYAETSVGEFILGTRLDASRAGSRFEAPR